MSLGELWLCLDLLHGFFFLDVHCPFSPPLTSRKPYESTYTSTASQTFSDSTQQIIIFLSENHHVRTMSLCIKKKRVVWKLSNLSSLPAHLPKTSHFDFVKACRQVDEPNGSQRKSHLISAGSAYCCRWYLVFFSNLTIHGSHDIKFPWKVHLPRSICPSSMTSTKCRRQAGFWYIHAGIM